MQSRYKQIKTDMQTHFDHQGQMDEILNTCMKKISRSHKNAMVQEINKRQEKKKERGVQPPAWFEPETGV